MPVSTSHRPSAPIDKLVTAYAINAPSALGEDLFVVVPSASGNRSQVVGWVSKTPLPVADDQCLVAYDENGNPWVVAWLSDLPASGPGAWTALTLGPKIEASGSAQSIRVRLEQGASSVRMRGTPVVKIGETLTAGETLATLPLGFRPPGLITVPMTTSSAVTTSLTIATTGVVALANNLAATRAVFFDGLTFNLT